MAQVSSAHMREYETIYVLKNELDDDAAIAFITKMKGVVETGGGQHVQVQNWGRRKLAWERDRQQKGMFVHHRYLGPSTLVKEYERTLKIAEDCILRQTVLRNKAVDPAAMVPEPDQLKPPAQKEPRPRDREERSYGGRDRDDRDDRGGRGDRDRDDRGGRDRDDRGDRNDRD